MSESRAASRSSGRPGGHQGALGWQLAQADLAFYAGNTIRLRFAFQSNASNTYPGVYVDDVSLR
jgi:bacillopeptidase F (M6 metalloprotease family)